MGIVQETLLMIVECRKINLTSGDKDLFRSTVSSEHRSDRTMHSVPAKKACDPLRAKSRELSTSTFVVSQKQHLFSCCYHNSSRWFVEIVAVGLSSWNLLDSSWSALVASLSHTVERLTIAIVAKWSHGRRRDQSPREWQGG